MVAEQVHQSFGTCMSKRRHGAFIAIDKCTYSSLKYKQSLTLGIALLHVVDIELRGPFMNNMVIENLLVFDHSFKPRRCIQGVLRSDRTFGNTQMEKQSLKPPANVSSHVFLMG
jgi:hypothetical protein